MKEEELKQKIIDIRKRETITELEELKLKIRNDLIKKLEKLRLSLNG